MRATTAAATTIETAKNSINALEMRATATAAEAATTTTTRTTAPPQYH